MHAECSTVGMHAECSTVGMFADMQNVEELACVGMQGLGTSRSEDSKNPEFQNLKAPRTVVSLFVHFVVFGAFSDNSGEGPFGAVSGDVWKRRFQDSTFPEFGSAPGRRGLACIHWDSLRVSWALLGPLGGFGMLGPRS